MGWAPRTACSWTTSRSTATPPASSGWRWCTSATTTRPSRKCAHSSVLDAHAPAHALDEAAVARAGHRAVDAAARADALAEAVGRRRALVGQKGLHVLPATLPGAPLDDDRRGHPRRAQVAREADSSARAALRLERRADGDCLGPGRADDRRVGAIHHAQLHADDRREHERVAAVGGRHDRIAYLLEAARERERLRLERDLLAAAPARAGEEAGDLHALTEHRGVRRRGDRGDGGRLRRLERLVGADRGALAVGGHEAVVVGRLVRQARERRAHTHALPAGAGVLSGGPRAIALRLPVLEVPGGDEAVRVQ